MDYVAYLFVDWRPVTTVPVSPRLIGFADWRPFALTGPLTQDLRGEFGDIEIRYRFACRNDGLILFCVQVPTPSRRTAVRIARAVSYRIKEKTGHTHVFDNPDWNGYNDHLTIQPVLCASDQGAIEIEGFCALALDEPFLQSLKAKSPMTGRPSETPALLTLKQFYSRLFDRVSRRADRKESAVVASVSATNRITRQRGRAWIYAVAGIVFVVAMTLLSLDSAYEWGARARILAGSFVILCGLVALTHASEHVGRQLNQTIRLYRTLIAHCAHGNTLSRALHRFYQPPSPPPGPEYDSIIRLAQEQVDALVRRINNYYFTFSAVVGLFAILMSFVV